MSFASLLTESATIKRRVAGTDAHGQPNGAWTDTYLNVPCFVDTRGATGYLAATDRAADTTSQNVRIFFAAGVDILATDQVVISGEIYAMDGVSSVHGHHIEATAKVTR